MIALVTLMALPFGQSADATLASPTARELEMLNEVNFVRTRPAEYAAFVDEYTVYWEYSRSELAAASELKTELGRMKPVDSLKWSPELYHDAVAHGNWMMRTRKFDHSDYPWAENLVSGDENIRYAILNLLIDAGIPSRGHRRNILNPANTVFACHELPGKVGIWDYVFVQEFD